MAKNLLLVSYPDGPIAGSFEQVARFVRAHDPRVRPQVVTDRRYRGWRLRWALRPTLVFSPLALERLRVLRGAVFEGAPMPKSVQCARLDAAGVPVPRWARLTEGQPPDLSAFGPYVVVKPDQGLRGSFVRIVRRDRVRWKPAESGLDAGNTDSLVQEFVYTGRWPVTYRVLTLFGEVLYAVRGEGNHARRPLEGRYRFAGARDVGGVNIVGSARDGTWSLVDDPDVLDVARRAHAAFPEVGLLGVDVVRDAETGRVYVLETNPGGWTWHFASRTGLEVQEEFGLDLAGQFDGLRKAARVLVDKVHAAAR